MIRVIALILSVGVPLLAGYGIGRLGRKRAVAQAYTATLPVLRAGREVLTADPVTPRYSLARQVLQDEIDKYESEVRAL